MREDAAMDPSPLTQATKDATFGIGASPLSASSSEPAALSSEVADKLSKALGQGLVQCWSDLPQDVQHDVFEATVRLEGEAIRQPLALYLHGKHNRTLDSMRARAMPEPDSLGG